MAMLRKNETEGGVTLTKAIPALAVTLALAGCAKSGELVVDQKGHNPMQSVDLEV